METFSGRLDPILQSGIKYKTSPRYVSFPPVSRPLGAPYAPIDPREVEEEQRPSEKGERRTIVVGVCSTVKLSVHTQHMT